MNRNDEMRDECQEWHEKHPKVWELFVLYAFDRINRGFKHYGAKSIMERIRWETNQATDVDGGFKIGNNHTAFYSRRFMEMYPRHDGFFRTREQTSRNDQTTNRPEFKLAGTG